MKNGELMISGPVSAIDKTGLSHICLPDMLLLKH